MPFNYEALMALRIEARVRFERNDTILYALGVGAGIDAAETGDLRLVYENSLQALPTFAVAIAYPGFWLRDPQYRVTWHKALHGEQSVTLHRPLPVEGEMLSVLTVDEIYDKGAEKGAVLYATRRLSDAASGELLATLKHSVVLRGDGGIAGSRNPSPLPHPLPDRAHDISIALETRPEQALLYRLSGDNNPLHIDPAVAGQAGFPRPILHGLATYGVVGRALIKGLCDGDASRLRRIDARFSTPVYPGETIVTEIWCDNSGKASFCAKVEERGATVINNGYAELF